jgi:hypothetical protein
LLGSKRAKDIARYINEGNVIPGAIILLLLNVMLAATYIYQTYHVYRVNKHIFTETLPCRLVQ